MNETTIGARLAQCRKERGLSQEGLGEKLGVSRQAIYKWESDQSLPEIDKLIAMSKLFAVSVGWILGVEDTQQNTTTENGELTETQLAMVEEIVARYIAAQPVQPTQPAPKKRRRWPYVVAICGVVVVFANLFSRLDQMNSQYSNLQSSVSHINETVYSQIDSITQQVEQALKNQNNLTADYSTEYLARDLRANTATFSLQAVPKTYVEGMEAIFVADSGDGPVEQLGTLGAGQKFSAELTCPLTDDINLSVVFVSGDQKETQLLEEYSGFYSISLPELYLQEHSFWCLPLDRDGARYVFQIPNSQGAEYVIFRDDATPAHQMNGTNLKESAPIQSIQVGLFQNQKLLGWAEECDQPANFSGDYTGQQFYRLPTLTVSMGLNDRLCVAAVVTDIYGRTFVWSETQYVPDDSGGDDHPILDFADDWTADSSVDAWEF